MRRFPHFLMIVILVLSLSATACAPQAVQVAPTQPAKSFKMAAIFAGVITDADYNTMAYISLSKLKSELGIQTTYVENVQPAAVEQVMKDYVDQQYNVIWTHGSQFVNQTIGMAAQFPEVTFIAEGDVPVENTPANVWFITRNFHTGFYALGATAGMVSKTGKIGYIAGATLPFTYAEIHAIKQALFEQGLDVELQTAWTGDFNDPARAREAAQVMIDNGVDVIMGSLNLGMVGVFEAVKASGKPVLVTAKYSDKTAYAPQNYMTALLYEFANPLKEILEKVQQGEKGGVYSLTFIKGVSLQSPLQNVPTDVQAKADALIQQIKDGKIVVINDVRPIQ